MAVLPFVNLYASLFSLPAGAEFAAHIDDARRRRLLFAICLGSAVVAVIAYAIRVAFGTPPSLASWAAFSGISLSLYSTLVLLRLRVPVARAAMLPIFCMTAGIPFLASQNGGLNAPVIVLAPGVAVVAAIFLDAKKAVLVAVALAVEVMIVALAGQLGWLPSVQVAPLAKGGILVAYMFVNVIIVAAHELERRDAEARLRAVAIELYQSSIIDPLTHVFNRRHFAQRLAEELAYARRHDASVGVMVLDVDHFKQINDGLGHDAGDFVLKQLATLLRQDLRAEDVLARFGGEEFVVLARGTSPDQLAVIAERLRENVAAHGFEYEGTPIRVTVSIGCATASGNKASEELLLSVADERMYNAKKSGRNRVVFDDIAPPVPPGIRFVSSIPLRSLPSPLRLSCPTDE